MADYMKTVFLVSVILTIVLLYVGRILVDQNVNVEFSFKLGSRKTFFGKQKRNVTSRVICGTAKRDRILVSDLRLDKNFEMKLDEDQKACLSILTNKSGIYKFMDDHNFDGIYCNESTNKRFLKPREKVTTVLASYPGSGNTWTRHLLEELTGIYTGSVSNDGKLNKTFKGEGHTENVLVVKTHRFPVNVTYLNFSRTILLIRDPFESLLSYYNYESKGHTGILTEKEASISTFQDFVKKRMKVYKLFHFEWLAKHRGSLFILYYRDLKKDLLNTLIRLSTFLETNVTLKQLWCVNQQQTGRFKRGPKPGWQDRSKLVTSEIGRNLTQVEQDVAHALQERVRMAKSFIVF